MIYHPRRYAPPLLSNVQMEWRSRLRKICGRLPDEVNPMRSLLFRCCALAAMAIVSAAPLSAHHSFGAEYDSEKTVTLTGVVVKIEWTNPHSYIYLDVKDAKDAKAAVIHWKLEGYPPNVLYRTGWKRDTTMKVGDTVTIFGWRARDGSNNAHSREVTFHDGSKLFFGPPAGTGDGGPTAPVKVP